MTRDELDKIQARVLQNYGIAEAAGFDMCLRTMWQMLEQERARSQKLVEALEQCTYDDCGYDLKAESHGSLVAMVENIDRCARHALEAHKAGEK